MKIKVNQITGLFTTASDEGRGVFGGPQSDVAAGHVVPIAQQGGWKLPAGPLVLAPVHTAHLLRQPPHFFVGRHRFASLLFAFFSLIIILLYSRLVVV